MLIDAQFDEAFQEVPQRIGRGIYVNCALNFHYFLPSGWEDRWGVIYDAHHSGNLTLWEASVELDRIPAYGVVDSPEKFLELFGAKLEEDPGHHAVGFTRVTKEECPDFRWHKFGEYLGTQKPQCECLGDEEFINVIYTFSVMTKRENNEQA